MENDMSEKDESMDEVLPDFYTIYRTNPKTEKEVPGKFIWTPDDPSEEFDDVLATAPSSDEEIPPAPLPELSDEITLCETGLTTEPSIEEIEGYTSGDVGVLSMSRVRDKYYHGCTCRKSYANNCAHYLSNAFILAGYRELLSSNLITHRCSHGRPTRAQDMLKWFKAKKVGFYGSRVKRNTGIWAVYQEKPGWRHVVLIDSDRWKHSGTGDYHNWPVQWNYRLR
jgi:hypothetical protein